MRYGLATLLVAVFVFPSLGMLHVYAQNNASNLSGASNASDYQPPTRNPQAGVTGPNQTTGSVQTLPNLNQTALPSVGDLHVNGAKAGATNSNTTKTAPPSDVGHNLNYWPLLIIGFVTIAGVAFVVVQPDPSKAKARRKAASTSAPTPVEVEPPVKKSKKTTGKKKSSRAKRKGRR